MVDAKASYSWYLILLVKGTKEEELEELEE